MPLNDNTTFFKLLRVALGMEQQFDCKPDGDEWLRIFKTVQQQSLIGVVFTVLDRLKPDQRPPAGLTLQWMSKAEFIRGTNHLMNTHSARLTTLLEAEGAHTAILKGQANARLYPNPFSRQPGDIDIYVSGGRDNVTQLLIRIGLLESVPKLSDIGNEDKATSSYHHVHLPQNEDGVSVEVHFRPSSGNFNPITNRRLQKYLESEVLNSEMVPEGFRVPPVRFALMMQLAHIQRHYFEEGIGLRQICDYLVLLQHSSEEDRTEVNRLLVRCGLRKTCGALMSLMREVFGLDDRLMLSKPDERRGKRMLQDVMEGGNFGRYANPDRKNPWKRFSYSKRRKFSLLSFDFREIVWSEIHYWKSVIETAPERFRRGSLSLSEKPRRKR
ncbi:MAG: nucleotidyltransferase family protein [Bacteroidales bacterium]|nr:nucleotidyltransferase family protein [Bacteroidales bacterium]